MVNTKLKPILPSLREKKRYLVFEVISQEKVSDFSAVSEIITRCSLHFMGQLDAARAGVMALGNKWDTNLQRGIVRVGHKHVDDLKSALVFAHKIGDKEVIIRSLGVSGILKKAENNFFNPSAS